MIGTSIALGIWTSGLLWMTTREEKKRLLLNTETIRAEEKTHELENIQRLEEKV